MKRRPRRGLMLVLLVATAVGCAAGNAREALPGAESDVRLFASELARIHLSVSMDDVAARVREPVLAAALR